MGLIGLAAAFISGLSADFHSLHLGAGYLNDQLVYVSVARHFVDTGKLQSSVIYPSTLLQHATHDYFYMPGYFMVLAAAFRWFGYSPFVAVLPSLISYALVPVLVYLIGLRVYGPGVATAAGLLSASLAPFGLFACVAMMELPFAVTCLGALAGFLYLPTRAKPLIGPALLAIPFFFRELAALLLIPLVVLTFARLRPQVVGQSHRGGLAPSQDPRRLSARGTQARFAGLTSIQPG